MKSLPKSCIQGLGVQYDNLHFNSKQNQAQISRTTQLSLSLSLGSVEARREEEKVWFLINTGNVIRFKRYEAVVSNGETIIKSN